ncbi:MAG TPA: hypothetical protein VGR45_01075 [Stellaceae bacterium]|nr:hypothetical protein [Stellaceae bacterium]
MRRPTRFGLVLSLAIVASALVALIATRCTSVAARAWLTAYLFWTGLPIGALFLILTHGLTGGAAAALIRLNLLTPQGLLLDAETYNRTFTLW